MFTSENPLPQRSASTSMPHVFVQQHSSWQLGPGFSWNTWLQIGKGTLSVAGPGVLTLPMVKAFTVRVEKIKGAGRGQWRSVPVAQWGWGECLGCTLCWERAQPKSLIHWVRHENKSTFIWREAFPEKYSELENSCHPCSFILYDTRAQTNSCTLPWSPDIKESLYTALVVTCTQPPWLLLSWGSWTTLSY